MTQDDRKGQPPSTRGRSPAPNAPDSPDTRGMNAPPPPEAPDAPAPLEPPAQPGSVAGDLDTEGHAGERAGSSERDPLRGEVDKVREAVEAKEAEVAGIEAEGGEDEAIAKLVSGYAPEVSSLRAAEQNLRQYRHAETSFLERLLPPEARDAIREIHHESEQEIARLWTGIEQKAGGDAESRALAEARQSASRARETVEALMRPAASVRDRIRRADAIRAEAAKASDSGRYALAYWLVMDGGPLERAIEAEPRIREPEDLGDAIRSAVAVQREADRHVAALARETGATGAALQKDQGELAERQGVFDAAVLARLSELDPPIHPAA